MNTEKRCVQLVYIHDACMFNIKCLNCMFNLILYNIILTQSNIVYYNYNPHYNYWEKIRHYVMNFF